MKAPNPFHPKGVVPHNLFAGRGEQVAKILKKLTQVNEGIPSSFFFVGDRGIGKTALARLIRWVAQSSDNKLHKLHLTTAYYSVAKGQKTSDVLQAVLNEATDSMSTSVLAVLANRLGSLFKNGKFSIGAFGLSVEASIQTSDTDVVVRDQVVSILSNVIAAVRQEGKDGLLLIIDEVNNLQDIEECAQLIRGVMTTLNVKEKGNVAFILIGYKDTARAFFQGDPSARRSFDETPLEAMPTDEALEVLKKGFDSAGVTWDVEVAKVKIALAGGYPHAVQLFGHNVYEVDSDGHIDSEDWTKAMVSTASELQSKEFASMYSFRGKKGVREKVLDFLSETDGWTYPNDLNKKCAGSNVYRTLKQLKAEGSIIEDNDGKLKISSQLLRLAILLSHIGRK